MSDAEDSTGAARRPAYYTQSSPDTGPDIRMHLDDGSDTNPDSPSERGFEAGWFGLSHDEAPRDQRDRLTWFRAYDKGAAARARLERIRATKGIRA